jgi:hypothetical protein
MRRATHKADTESRAPAAAIRKLNNLSEKSVQD